MDLCTCSHRSADHDDEEDRQFCLECDCLFFELAEYARIQVEAVREVAA